MFINLTTIEQIISMAIRLFITGGTIDCEKVGHDGNYIFTETHVPEMLKQSRNEADVKLEILMLKDSIHMDGADREKILQKCKSCEEDRIIITHGTDTMVETAQVLGKNIRKKTIVLLGAMVPYNNKTDSDALFNLGGAMTAAQLLPYGVYIAMHGKIFSWDNVRKNKAESRFEEIK